MIEIKKTLRYLQIPLRYPQKHRSRTLFNICCICILDDVARELRGKRKNMYLEEDTTWIRDHKHQNLNHPNDSHLIISYMLASI
jgi:hypothetical protein